MKRALHLRELFMPSRKYRDYTYGGMVFRLPRDTCDNLEWAEWLSRTMREDYLASRQSSTEARGDFLFDLQRCMLKLWREFDRICTKCGFSYFLVSGSLLGAYRHQGFIPWDDDFDVCMPREHYERIIEEFNRNTTIPGTVAGMLGASRGLLFTKIAVTGEPLIYMDVFPFDCYAEAPDAALIDRLNELHRQRAVEVQPKGVEALINYYSALRKSFGLTPVPYDSPECRTVFIMCEAWGYGPQKLWEASKVFPLTTMPFEKIDMPVPADPEYCLTRHMGPFDSYPVDMKLHYNYRPLTLDCMLNIKRFLRDQPLRLRAGYHPGTKRTSRTKLIRNRILTALRNFVAPVFSTRTHHMVREYHIFSHSFYKLRCDRVLRASLEAIREYHRVIRAQRVFPLAEGAVRRTQVDSLSMLRRVTNFCGSSGLQYWAWSETLLGTFRNGRFLATAEQAVLMMPRPAYDAFRLGFNRRENADDVMARLVMHGGGVATRVTRQGSSAGVLIFPCDRYAATVDPEETVRTFRDNVDTSALSAHAERGDAVGYHDCCQTMRLGMPVDRDEGAACLLAPGCEYPPEFVEQCFFSEECILPLKHKIFEGVLLPLPADPEMILTALFGNYVHYLGDGKKCLH